MGTFLQDVRFGLRMLAKSRAFLAVALLTLALGIGVNTALFSLVNGILLRPLPYPQSKDLISFTAPLPKGAFVALQSQVRSMDVAAFSRAEFNLAAQDGTARFNGASISANLFNVLNVQPALGRMFEPGEDQTGDVRLAIISYQLWQANFRSDPDILERPINLDGLECRVVGVMPKGFEFPSIKTAIWVPLRLDPADFGNYWGSSYMPIIGRLRGGMSVDNARAEVRQLMPAIREAFPWTMPKTWGADISVVGLQEAVVSTVRIRLLVLLAAVALILLIACANVANLLLARATTRVKEIAIRLALGSSRGRILRQLLTEHLVLASAGGILGLGFAASSLSVLKAILPADTPGIGAVMIDGPVLGFTLVLVILTGFVFGTAPALVLARVNSPELLKSSRSQGSSRASHRIRSLLVISEIALSVILSISAGLLMESLWNLTNLNLGFREKQILTAEISPNEELCSAPGRCESFYADLLDGVSILPGIESAAAVSGPPLEAGTETVAANVEGYVPGAGESPPLLWERVVTSNYHQIMGIPLLAGRTFTATDSAAGAPLVVIVTASTAHRYWPGRDAVGKTIGAIWQPDKLRTVVGVVGDTREYIITKNLPTWVDGEIYIPYGDMALRANGSNGPLAQMTLVMRTSGDRPQIAAELSGVVKQLNRNVPPPTKVKAMKLIVSESIASPRSTTWVLALIAALALALSTIGIYGVVAYLVFQRSHEIGVRVALGAQQNDVLSLILKQGMKFALIGVVAGLGAALWLTRLTTTLLYGVRAIDPAIFIAISVFLTCVALVACYIPARRALHLDPMVALRYE